MPGGVLADIALPGTDYTDDSPDSTERPAYLSPDAFTRTPLFRPYRHPPVHLPAAGAVKKGGIIVYFDFLKKPYRTLNSMFRFADIL